MRDPDPFAIPPAPGAADATPPSHITPPPAPAPTDAITDDLDALLAVLPAPLRRALARQPDNALLLEIVLDLGRPATARYPDREIVLGEHDVETAGLQAVVRKLGEFGGDNRAGIARTLHRISCIRNRRDEIVGLTMRVGRAVYGTVRVIDDLVQSGESILLLGRPGVGKTTMLREVARVLSETGKRVVVVDTSNEIAGDGDIPHPGIGRARRMQVPTPAQQHAVMVEAVENHMPEVIIIDENRHRTGGAGRPHDRGAGRAIGRDGAREHARQPDDEPHPVRPDRRHPDRHPLRRGGPPPRHPQVGARAHGPAHLRRAGRDPVLPPRLHPPRRRADRRRAAARRGPWTRCSARWTTRAPSTSATARRPYRAPSPPAWSWNARPSACGPWGRTAASTPTASRPTVSTRPSASRAPTPRSSTASTRRTR